MQCRALEMRGDFRRQSGLRFGLLDRVTAAPSEAAGATSKEIIAAGNCPI